MPSCTGHHAGPWRRRVPYRTGCCRAGCCRALLLALVAGAGWHASLSCRRARCPDALARVTRVAVGAEVAVVARRPRSSLGDAGAALADAGVARVVECAQSHSRAAAAARHLCRVRSRSSRRRGDEPVRGRRRRKDVHALSSQGRQRDRGRESLRSYQTVPRYGSLLRRRARSKCGRAPRLARGAEKLPSPSSCQAFRARLDFEPAVINRGRCRADERVRAGETFRRCSA